MCSINEEELVNAYILLQSRCMKQSLSWVLDFLVDLNPEIILPEQEKCPVKVAAAKNYFEKGEFKAALSILQNRNDQQSISIYFLSKILDTQRQLQQTVPEDTPFIANLPVITQHQYGAFEEILTEASEKSSTFDAINLYLFAVINVKCGKYKEAIQLLIQSLNLFPINKSAWKLLLSCLLRFDTSEIDPAMQKLPNHWTTELFSIEILSELQQGDEAEKKFSELNIPRTAAIIQLEATIYYNRRTFPRATEVFRELRSKYPLKLEGLELYSNILFVQESLSELSELAQSAAQIDKFRPETLCIIGNLFAQSKKHEDAIEQFTLALRFDPEFTTVWTLIGHEYVELQNMAAATAAYTRAFEANPRDFRALYGLGRAFELTEMPHHAILFYRKAVAINPFDSRMWMALGECYEELNESSNAIKCYQRAVCNTDTEGNALFKLGKLYRSGFDNDRAAFCFESFLEKLPAADDAEDDMRENIRESVRFLASYFFTKKNRGKATKYANMMIQDATMAEEGKSLLKDILRQ